MKKAILIAVLVLIMSAAGSAFTEEQKPATDPLIGLWEFERTDNLSDWDFHSYVELTADGLYIFQMIEDTGVSSLNIDRYTEEGDSFVCSKRGGLKCRYTVEDNILIQTGIDSYGQIYTLDRFHRVTERPSELLTVRRSGDFCYLTDDVGNAAIAKYIDRSGMDYPVLTIPDKLDGHSVTSIRWSAFEGCCKELVILPESLTAVDAYAFSGAEIDSVFIHDGVTVIKAGAFSESNIQSIKLPASVRTIERDAFSSCALLSTVILPEGLEQIGKNAFSGCSSLKSISLPNSLKVIEGNPFCNCEALKEIDVSDDHPALLIDDGVLFSRDYHRLIWYPRPASAESYIIPDGTVIIEESAFAGNRFLEAVTIPDSVEVISMEAFRGCSRLYDIIIPDSVTELGNSVFSNDYGLKRVHLPTGLKKISNYMFYDCVSLSEIQLPPDIAEIGLMAFYSCHSLTTVILPDGLATIGSQAFEGCYKLSVIKIPDTVTKIYSSAFDHTAKREGSDSTLQVIVTPGTYAEQYCIDSGLPVIDSATATMNPSTVLYPVRKNGLFGYMDWRGQTVIETRYKECSPWFGKYAAVTVDGENWGIINALGKEILPCEYRIEWQDDCRGLSVSAEDGSGNRLTGIFDIESGVFSGLKWKSVRLTWNDKDEEEDDLLPVEGLNRKWGYADPATGEEVIPCGFFRADVFHEGWAGIEFAEDGHRWYSYDALINQKGEFLYAPEGMQINSSNGVSGGWIDIRDLETGLIGYMDMQGNITLKPQWDNAFGFKGNFAVVQDFESQESYYIDRTGKRLPGIYARIEGDIGYAFSYGITDVLVTDETSGVRISAAMDEDGQILFVMSSGADLLPFFGIAAWYRVEYPDEGVRYGLIDWDGNLITDSCFGCLDEVGSPFNEDLAAVEFEGFWGYIDCDGEWAIPQQYDAAASFHDGLAQVMKDGKMMYIDRHGAVVWEEE